MAEFAQPKQAGSDPSYIGFSRETGGDRAMASLVKNVGDLVGTGFRVADEYNRNQVAKDVQAGVTGVNESFVGGDSNAPSSANDEVQASEDGEDNAVDLFGSDQTASNGDISSGTATASRLTSAYKQGKLPRAAYWGKMVALAKELKTRYPGYADEVDKQFRGITGNIPANALAEAKRKEYSDSVASVSQEEKKFNQTVASNLGYLPADYFQRIKEGNPYGKLETYEHIAKRKAQDLQTGAIKDKLAISNAQGNLDQENAVGAASDALNYRSAAILGSITSKQLVERIQGAVASGASVNPQELEQLRGQWGMLRLKAEQALNEELQKPTSDGKFTWYSLIKDPGKIKAIKEQALAQYDSLQKMLDDKDFGAFAATLNANKAMVESTKNELYKRPFWRFVDVAATMGNRELLGQMMIRPAFMGAMGEEIKATMDHLTAQIAAAEKMPLTQQLNAVQKAAGGNKEDAKKGAREIIANNIAALTSDKATKSSKETAAENMFGAGQENFLAKAANNAQRKELYTRMVSPMVTRNMAEVRESNPELWSKYRNWAKASFMALQKGNIASVQEGVVERENIDVEWNGTRFVLKGTDKGYKAATDKLTGQSSLMQGVEDSMTQSTIRAVETLNKEISLLEGVLKVDGGDVSAELSTLFRAMGVDTTQGKTPTIFQKFRNAIDLYLNPPEPAKKD